MKFNLLLSIICAFAVNLTANATNDIKDILNGLTGGDGSGIGTIINNVLTSSKITINDMEGTWNYQEPAVEFKSDNLLQKAGGAAASTAIVNKIKPYYEKAGIQNLVFTCDSIGNFSFSTGKISLPGTIVQSEEDGVFEFQFKALGKVSIGKITTYVSKSATGQLKITFDASKLITLVNGIAKISGNSSLQSASSLLNSYDGLTAGFVLKKTK